MAVGKSAHFSWDYSERSDILNVRVKGRKTKESAELGDFTVDFGEDGSIVGIEILNASEFFRLVNIPKEALARIKAAEILVQKRRGHTLTCLKLLLPQNIEHVIPLPAAIADEAAVAAA